MNLDDIFETGSFKHKAGFWHRLAARIEFLLNHLLIVAGVVLFWVFMIALLTSPAWMPALVNGILIR